MTLINITNHYFEQVSTITIPLRVMKIDIRILKKSPELLFYGVTLTGRISVEHWKMRGN